MILSSVAQVKLVVILALSYITFADCSWSWNSCEFYITYMTNVKLTHYLHKQITGKTFRQRGATTTFPLRGLLPQRSNTIKCFWEALINFADSVKLSKFFLELSHLIGYNFIDMPWHRTPVKIKLTNLTHLELHNTEFYDFFSFPEGMCGFPSGKNNQTL